VQEGDKSLTEVKIDNAARPCEHTSLLAGLCPFLYLCGYAVEPIAQAVKKRSEIFMTEKRFRQTHGGCQWLFIMMAQKPCSAERPQ